MPKPRKVTDKTLTPEANELADILTKGEWAIQPSEIAAAGTKLADRLAYAIESHKTLLRRLRRLAKAMPTPESQPAPREQERAPEPHSRPRRQRSERMAKVLSSIHSKRGRRR